MNKAFPIGGSSHVAVC